MGLDYGLMQAMLEDIKKGEDEEAYRKLAEKGMDLIHPVTVQGNTHRPDINIPYHTSIKVFNAQKDHPQNVHDIASQLDLTPPNSKEVKIEPTTLRMRDGRLMHVIRLHGPHADTIKQHNGQFKHMGFEQPYEFHPHVTVDKDTWDRIRSSGARTAHEAGIQFGHAQLRHGKNILADYGPKKLAASEKVCMPKKDFVEEHKDLVDVLKHPTPSKLKTEAKEQSEELKDLDKGFISHLGTALGVAGALATASPAQAKAPKYTTQRMLNTISQVESSGGKNVQHDYTNHGQAYGKYALMPDTIRDTIKMHPDLRNKHGKALMLEGQDLHHYMDDNPGLEDMIAQRHVKRIEHHFGKNPEKIGYAWLNGIQGTYNAKNSNVDIPGHWHVKKIKEAYNKK